MARTTTKRSEVPKPVSKKVSTQTSKGGRALRSRKPVDTLKSLNPENKKKNENIVTKETVVIENEQEKKNVVEDVKEERKFFKSKGRDKLLKLEADKNIKPKRKPPGPNKRKKQSIGVEFNLKESSSDKNVKALRPRKKEKNYCEDSLLLEKHLQANKRKSVIKLHKLTATDGAKVPVYKCLKSDESQNEGEKIYEFDYDNDSQDKLLPQRKKTQKVKKMAKTKVPTKKVSKVLSSNVDKPNEKVKPPVQKETSPIEVPVANEVENMENSVNVIQVPSDKEKIIPVPKESKPVLRSIENLNEKGIHVKITSPDAVRSENTKANPLNGQSMIQLKNKINYSLLNKSLSPIKKMNEQFDVGSPWRPPPLQTFSQIKNLYQSTPYNNNKALINSRRIQHPGIRLVSKSTLNISQKNAVQKNQEDENQNKVKTPGPVNRRFGTEITNFDNKSIYSNPTLLLSDDKIQTSSSISMSATIPLAQNASNKMNPSLSTFDTLPLPSREIYETSLPATPISLISPPEDNAENNDIAMNKENTTPNNQTSKRSPKKRIKNGAPKTLRLQQQQPSVENSEPQPGPSGLQNLKRETRLRQSNLNNFLNLPETPESSRISTMHGIFTDMNSTPINGKKIPRVEENLPVIENAFGFSDSESDLNISPIETEKDSNEKDNVQNIKSKPARLSIGEIKNQLLKNKKKLTSNRNEKPAKDEKLCVNDEKRKEKEAAAPPIEDDNNAKNNNKVLIDAANFSDTFDVMSETQSSFQDNGMEVPLFVDLEPSRFSTPPKRLYKRKREVKFDLSGEDDISGDFIKEEKKPRTKKKRIHKNDEENQRLEEWVENVNKTFEEIDHFDLVVE